MKRALANLATCELKCTKTKERLKKRKESEIDYISYVTPVLRFISNESIM